MCVFCSKSLSSFCCIHSHSDRQTYIPTSQLAGLERGNVCILTVYTQTKGGYSSVKPVPVPAPVAVPSKVRLSRRRAMPCCAVYKEKEKENQIPNLGTSHNVSYQMPPVLRCFVGNLPKAPLPDACVIRRDDNIDDKEREREK